MSVKKKISVAMSIIVSLALFSSACSRIPTPTTPLFILTEQNISSLDTKTDKVIDAKGSLGYGLNAIEAQGNSIYVSESGVSDFPWARRKSLTVINNKTGKLKRFEVSESAESLIKAKSNIYGYALSKIQFVYNNGEFTQKSLPYAGFFRDYLVSFKNNKILLYSLNLKKINSKIQITNDIRYAYTNSSYGSSRSPYLVADTGNELYLINLQDKSIDKIKESRPVFSIIIQNNVYLFYSKSKSDSLVKVFNASTKKTTSEFLLNKPNDFLVSNDRLYITSQANPGIYIIKNNLVSKFIKLSESPANLLRINNKLYIYQGDKLSITNDKKVEKTIKLQDTIYDLTYSESYDKNPYLAPLNPDFYNR